MILVVSGFQVRTDQVVQQCHWSLFPPWFVFLEFHFVFKLAFFMVSGKLPVVLRFIKCPTSHHIQRQKEREEGTEGRGEGRERREGRELPRLPSKILLYYFEYDTTYHLPNRELLVWVIQYPLSMEVRDGCGRKLTIFSTSTFSVLE